MLTSSRFDARYVDTSSSRSSGTDGWLLGLVGALAVSGMFVYSPGSDVSAYAFSQSATTAPILILGRTALAWCSLLLILVAGYVGLKRHRDMPRGLWWALAGAVIYLGIRSVLALAAGDGDLDSTARLALPLLLFAALATQSSRKTLTFEYFFILVNILLIGQVLLCKLFTGSFGANRYYIELSEEYFGYYYHPFAFSGALSAISVYAVSKALGRERRALWLALLACNLYFIWNTQVRTFLVAATLGMLALAVVYAFARGRPVILAVLASAGLALLVFWTPQMLSGSRSVSEVSSGRLERWTSDIDGFGAAASDLEILIGRGPGSIYELNSQLFGVRINSLNLAVDTLVDFGVLGVVVLAIAWCCLLSSAKWSAPRWIGMALTVFFLATSTLTSMTDFPLVAALFIVMACSRSEPVAFSSVSMERIPIV